MYTILYKKSAQKSLQRMPRKMALKVIESFKKLAVDPTRKDLDINPLTGREGFRLRIGGWRAIYQIEQKRLVTHVLTIGARGDVYK
ncbi:addiction module toxin, RelE/StbE family [Nitrosococcus halophilus Nc 4]|uniref:Addiction module toxin, RelE/StbE family n=1 Tax=Nitrosococcus halophilus (strain Nc4) TaxID=472759 RepID=D5BWR0_NITHN|nr:type II toxin-antitoxin system RelE/ParE family toxin [Nitrosococcus halophilus]ADE13791.1 addiction module toxin, RelE/StbE family [Nitrosococcus halophilus Nc 4]